MFDSTENIFTPTCKNNDQQVISIKSQVNFILKSNNFRWSLEVLFGLQMMIVKVKHICEPTNEPRLQQTIPHM